MASAKELLSVVSAILDRNETDVNTFNDDGITALIFAANRGNVEIVERLLEP